MGTQELDTTQLLNNNNKMPAASPLFLSHFLHTLVEDSSGPNNETKTPQKVKPVQGGRKLPLLAQTAPSLHLTSCQLPPSGPCFHSDHSSFLQRPPFWKKDCTHFVSSLCYIFLLTAALHQKRSKGARRKRKEATSQMNIGALRRRGGHGAPLPDSLVSLDTDCMNQ